MRSTIDERPRRLCLELAAGESAESALEQALSLLKARPDLWSWDWIVVAIEVPEDASLEQISRLAEAYDRSPVDAMTVIVSEDRFLHLWARVMNYQFPGRNHVVMGTLAEARAHIEALRAGDEALSRG